MRSGDIEKSINIEDDAEVQEVVVDDELEMIGAIEGGTRNAHVVSKDIEMLEVRRSLYLRQRNGNKKIAHLGR